MLDDLAERRQAQARALLRQELKPGRAWSSLQYEYDYTPEDVMSYLGWYDDNPKKATTDKAWEAIAAYRQKFEEMPNVILVNEADRQIELGGITIRVESYIRRNNFWVGFERGLP